MHDGLQAGAADAIDGFAGHLDRHTGLERRLARHVHPGARLEHATHDDVADLGGRHRGARDRFADDQGAKIDGGEILERAAERADWRAAGAENDGVGVVGHCWRAPDKGSTPRFFSIIRRWRSWMTR